MRIPCPWCGPRLLNEFTYGGDASKTRPNNPDSASLDTWMDYVYLRKNPAGRHTEYWHHSSGCRSWLVVTRDTISHEITEVTPADPNAGGDTS
jgi:sarcosine oxidase subunit delta